MSVSMTKKTLANYSLPGHPVKFCKVKWQLTYKKLNPFQFVVYQTRQKHKKNLSQICLTTFLSIYLHFFKTTCG